MRIAHRNTAASSTAFSLIELQVGVVLLLFVIGVAVTAHMFGLSMFQRARLKLTATEEARLVLGRMREEIKCAANVVVGTGDHNNFIEIGDNTNQMGSALQIFPTTNANNYIIYYADDRENIHKWTTAERRLLTLASSVTNRVVFSARDFRDNVLTNNENNRVILVTLQMLEKQHSRGGISDYYQVQTRATRRLVQ